jgi:hypothetical protein
VGGGEEQQQIRDDAVQAQVFHGSSPAGPSPLDAAFSGWDVQGKGGCFPDVAALRPVRESAQV